MDIGTVRKKTLHFLAATVLAANATAMIVLIVVDFVLRPLLEYRGAAAHNYAAAILMILGALAALCLNRRGKTDEAGYILVALVFLGTAISYLPKNVVVSHDVVIFASSIMLSSILLQPAYSFLMTALCGFFIGIIDVNILGKLLNPFSILVLLIIAIISWLACKIMKEAVLDLQESNAKLKAKTEAQHQELLQIVNDFAFLANERENAIILYGPDGELVFANKIALEARSRIGEESYSAYRAVVERAWEKNLSTRVNYNGRETDIVSSLIETDGGTCLLIQAVRLPDEESGRSLENCQQRLTVANNLPQDTEYDSHTGRMRAIVGENGHFSKKVLFNLTRTGYLVIKNPFSRQLMEFDIEDLMKLAKG